MLFFELNRQLDIRLFQTLAAVDPTYGSCAKYVFDKDSLILLGTDHSIRLDILNKSITRDNPIRNWDIESEAMLWFAQDSAESAIIRLINDAYRLWENIDSNITEEYFYNELEALNQMLAGYDLKAYVDDTGMSLFKDGVTLTFEQTMELIMDIDENRMDDKGIDNLINEAFFYRNMDRYEEAALLLEKVARYVDHTQPIYGNVLFSLAETYYFGGNYDRAVTLYYRIQPEHIQDFDDFYMHIGHALLDNKMKKYDRNLRIYYHSLLDSQYADNHRQAVVAAKAAIGDVFAEYEETCLEMGQKKYEEYRASLPEDADDIDDLLRIYEKPEEKPEVSHKRLSGFDLRVPRNSSDGIVKSINTLISDALEKYLEGEYQQSFEIYYRLKERVSSDSDQYTWVYLQLGKLYAFFEEPGKALECLEKCDPMRCGLVYREEDFLMLYRHVKIVNDDFESDSRYRILLRGALDSYFAQYDREYNLMQRDKKLCKAFKQYQKDCIEDSKFDLKDKVESYAVKKGLFSRLFKNESIW